MSQPHSNATSLPLTLARRALRSPTPRGLPPGPDLHPAFQLYRWLTDPIGFLQTECKDLGERFTLRFPGIPAIVVFSDPEGIREV